jgi:hypothetical protein
MATPVVPPPRWRIVVARPAFGPSRVWGFIATSARIADLEQGHVIAVAE